MDRTCPVCLENASESLISQPCGHAACTGCLRQWLNTPGNGCFLCRRGPYIFVSADTRSIGTHGQGDLSVPQVLREKPATIELDYCVDEDSKYLYRVSVNFHNESTGNEPECYYNHNFITAKRVIDTVFLLYMHMSVDVNRHAPTVRGRDMLAWATYRRMAINFRWIAENGESKDGSGGLSYLVEKLRRIQHDLAKTIFDPVIMDLALSLTQQIMEHPNNGFGMVRRVKLAHLVGVDDAMGLADEGDVDSDVVDLFGSRSEFWDHLKALRQKKSEKEWLY